ncbi:hypothetical protein [Pasteuria penetrans]|nr:hypothetical protein [Pasteuria penetrans]
MDRSRTRRKEQFMSKPKYVFLRREKPRRMTYIHDPGGIRCTDGRTLV